MKTSKIKIQFKDLSQLEKILICAAYAYEIESDPFITDQRFDDLSLELSEVSTKIIGFQSFTGQWIYDSIKQFGKAMILKELKKIRELDNYI